MKLWVNSFFFIRKVIIGVDISFYFDVVVIWLFVNYCFLVLIINLFVLIDGKWNGINLKVRYCFERIIRIFFYVIVDCGLGYCFHVF